MNRKEAIELVTRKIGNEPIISANGYISRDLFSIDDKTLVSTIPDSLNSRIRRIFLTSSTTKE